MLWGQWSWSAWRISPACLPSSTYKVWQSEQRHIYLHQSMAMGCLITLSHQPTEGASLHSVGLTRNLWPSCVCWFLTTTNQREGRIVLHSPHHARKQRAEGSMGYHNLSTEIHLINFVLVHTSGLVQELWFGAEPLKYQGDWKSFQWLCCVEELLGGWLWCGTRFYGN